MEEIWIIDERLLLISFWFIFDFFLFIIIDINYFEYLIFIIYDKKCLFMCFKLNVVENKIYLFLVYFI